MRTMLMFPLLAVATLICIAACSHTTTDSESSSAVSLEEVLERTRMAMSDVSTYRTSETSVTTDSNSELAIPQTSFSARQSHDRYRFGVGSPETDGSYYLEVIELGSRSFVRESDDLWQEQEPVFDRGEAMSPAGILLSYLDLDGIQLVSDDEVTDDGIPVYRLAATEKSELPLAGSGGAKSDRGWQVKTRTTSVLIDRESFRIVARIFDTRSEIHFSDESTAYTEWGRMVSTQRIYDYNAPIVIEAPGEYVPWPASPAVRG